MKHGTHGTRIAGNFGLAPPGAGIPWHERIAARVGLGVGPRMVSSARITADFVAEGRRVLDLVRPVSEADARRQVLIDRLAAMEDSSRNWSLYMVLDHLIQVDTAIWVLVRRLAGGGVADMEVRIESVKPSLDAGPDRVDAFAALLDRYAATLGRLGDLRRRDAHAKKHRHPWFGPLTAAQWHLLAARHHRIHRRQVERILAGLGQ